MISNAFHVVFALACACFVCQHANAECKVRLDILKQQQPLLPLQAISARFTLFVPVDEPPENIVSWPDGGPAFTAISGQRFTGIHSIGDSIVERYSRSIVSQRRSLNEAPVRLEAGECVSASFSLAAHWEDPLGGMYRAHPIFERPGLYELFWSKRAQPPQAIHSLRIDVNPAEGDDRKILDMLLADGYLRSAMLSPVNSPDPDAGASLRYIVENYPKSSYSDYARFALVRTLIVDDRNLDLSREDILEKTTRHFKSIRKPEETLPRYAAETLWPLYPLRGMRKAAVKAVLDAQVQRSEKFDEMIDKLVDLIYSSTEDRKLAVSYLQSIDHARFPYGANALILLRTVQSNLGMYDDIGKTQELMEQHWYDNFEWLEHKAEEIVDNERIDDPEIAAAKMVAAWRAFRVRKIPTARN